MSGRYRKKPVVIDAVQFDGFNAMGIVRWAENFPGGGFDFTVGRHIDKADTLAIKTLEGKMIASVGDWIIRGVQGEFYPCKPDIFRATYELVPADREIDQTDAAS